MHHASLMGQGTVLHVWMWQQPFSSQSRAAGLTSSMPRPSQPKPALWSARLTAGFSCAAPPHVCDALAATCPYTLVGRWCSATPSALLLRQPQPHMAAQQQQGRCAAGRCGVVWRHITQAQLWRSYLAACLGAQGCRSSRSPMPD